MFSIFKKSNPFQRKPPTTQTPAESTRNKSAVDLRGLWVDEADALARLDELAPEPQVRTALRQYIEQGYCILPGALSSELADQVATDAQNILAEPHRYVVRTAGKYTDPVGKEKLDVGDRIIELYGVSPAARDAIYTPVVSRVLQAIFAEPAIAIQSLYFEYGSQQGIHQDTAYVVSKRPLGLAAIWIALEDVRPGTGELCYYPGGHRFPHFLFGGERKHWIQNVDGVEPHHAFFRHLQEQAEQRGIAQETFLARKGDVLIWHADLPHGGTKIRQMVTRKSLVVHLVPRSVKANYSDIRGVHYHELLHASGNYFSARHYRLDQLDDQGRAPIMFDGGITERRKAA